MLDGDWSSDVCSSDLTSTWIFGRGGLQESSGEGGALDQAELFRAITRYHRIV
jgi:acetolactate synthase-1/2/3 large subunit